MNHGRPEESTCALSIVVPVYNVEEYLSQCLDSILAQRLTDHEVILVDDGSTDGSEQIIRQYVSSHRSFFRSVQQENQGPSTARNAGLTLARGKYVLFVDSDDFLSEGKLGRVVDRAVREEVDVLAANFVQWYGPGDVEPNKRHLPGGPTTGRTWLGDSLRLNKYQPFVWCKLYRRDFLARHHLSFATDLQIHEDELFNVQSLIAASRVVGDTESIYAYRKQRPGSLMTERRKDRTLRSLRATISVANTLCGESARLGDPALASLVQHRMLKLLTDRIHDALQPPGIPRAEFIDELSALRTPPDHRAMRIRRASNLLDYAALRWFGLSGYVNWRTIKHGTRFRRSRDFRSP